MLPSKQDVITIFARHPAVQFRYPVCRAFLVGSFARGEQRPDSDLDILLEVGPVGAFSEEELTDIYRERLERARYSRRPVPLWNGRPLDIYVTYDADADSRAKIELL
jgi:predicted nucleotidyltransferase